MKRIGEKLHTLRLRHGLTTRELAEQLQISHTQVNRIELGTRSPSAPLIFRISQFFKVSFDQLMNDELELE